MHTHGVMISMGEICDDLGIRREKHSERITNSALEWYWFIHKIVDLFTNTHFNCAHLDEF